MSNIRFSLLIAAWLSIATLGFPAAFLATHGLDPGGWPTGENRDVAQWFSAPGLTAIYQVSGIVVRTSQTYISMAIGKSPAFPDGGFVELLMIAGAAILLNVVIVGGARTEVRHPTSTRFGNAHFASSRDLSHTRAGLELGVDPATGRPVRVEVEGNLITIAPPRRGKTTGLVLPNLAFADQDAWAGPVVVIDPKGDAYRAARRRRRAMGRIVRCIDPLGLAGGRDRWNPLARRLPSDVLHLQAMAQSLLPQVDHSSEGGAYFRDRAVVAIVAAMQAAIRDGDAQLTTAAALVNDHERLLDAVRDRHDAVSADARSILMCNERTRSDTLTTAEQAFSWLLDAVMQDAVRDHTFDLADLCDGQTDLFIVLPADDRRKVLAPYIRLLLSDLFTAVRERRAAERLIVYIDEAFVLGAFDAILNAAGELPGYGVSLWTFWQSENQLIKTFGPQGAAILRDTAEVCQLFNLARANPDECRRWSEALGTYTGVDGTESKDPRTGQITTSRSAVAVPLVHPADMAATTQRRSIVFLNNPSYTTDPLLLGKTRADQDSRFADLLDPTPPVGARR